MRWCRVNFQCRGALQIWITVGQGPIALTVGAGRGCLDIFTLIYPFSPLSPSLWETARYRLKYCLKGPLNPNQPTNQHPLITEVENIFGDPWLFPAAFLPKYLTGCISHCCIVGGNHGINVYVLITQSNEWCELPAYRCLKSASHIWVPQFLKIKPKSWLVWLSRLLQTNSKGHHHQVTVTSYVCSRKTPCPMDVNS